MNLNEWSDGFSSRNDGSKQICCIESQDLSNACCARHFRCLSHLLHKHSTALERNPSNLATQLLLDMSLSYAFGSNITVLSVYSLLYLYTAFLRELEIASLVSSSVCNSVKTNTQVSKNDQQFSFRQESLYHYKCLCGWWLSERSVGNMLEEERCHKKSD